MSHEALNNDVEFDFVFEQSPNELIVEKLSDGLGFGHGSISSAKQEEAPGNEDLGRLTDEAIHDRRILTKVSVGDNGEPLTDDGCGDGRRTGLVFRRAEDDESLDKIYKSSLTRSKVFGGGLTMAAATRIGLGLEADRTMSETFSDTRKEMGERELDYGAHTAMVAHDNKTGCGAIDYAPEIVQAAVQYRQEIKATIDAVMGEDPELNEILDNFAGAAQADNAEYDSRQVMADTISDGKVVKALDEDHLETRILLNYVPGYTADQGFVRDYTGGQAQVFSVDVWRMTEIAEKMYDNPADQRRAVLSQLVYTLATSAVLTAGDLPVYALKQVPDSEDDSRPA